MFINYHSYFKPFNLYLRSFHLGASPVSRITRNTNRQDIILLDLITGYIQRYHSYKVMLYTIITDVQKE